MEHAWGIEPRTMQEIKAYTPASHSLSVGQVFPAPYSFEKMRGGFREMLEQLSFDPPANSAKTPESKQGSSSFARGVLFCICPNISRA